ncbi:alpha-L-fucosidase [Pedobacter hiemivivus]|uniref:alpha-L-fucosidase n=1 Tax=Pedobacter hiemivivus TaxID=2530454 RepID=A0A4U1G7N6_9SPHI|nr:alpha-L-fucosidase [Pedobacter hiemivivus]TKC56902.1 alpha-L-fucosidase [Pedobacter hiemivivus]
MKLRLIILLFAMSCSFGLKAQQYSPTAENLASRKDFQDMKFGMFIHWGAFSVLSDGEWVMNNKNIKVEDYKRLKGIFNPTAFDAKKWVDAAKGAGMKYITLITRHHDGFSNWDTKQSDWKITETPYGKDIVAAMAKECHKQGIKLFLYYSLLDWSRTDYHYATGKTGKGTGRTEKGDWNNYIAFMKAQLTELLTNYGEISGIWFDGHWDQLDNDKDKTLKSKVDWHYDEIYSLIHKLQPQCMVGNNHHLSPIAGEDFQMFEKDLPGVNTTGFGGASISQLPLETCETMNNSWGFSITDRKYKTVKQLIHYLVNDAGRNANFLLNVGPMPNGIIQPENIDTLAKIGEWTKVYGASIYGTRGNLIDVQEWGVVTAKDKTLYAHVINKLKQPSITLPKLKQKVVSATLMNGGAKLKFKQTADQTIIYLDGVAMDDIDTIIELKIK